jgi:hypothetical protein
MSNVATFEFRTSVNLCFIQQEVSERWTGKGRSIDIYTWANPVRTFCILEYFIGRFEEREMLCQVAKYLLKVAEDHCVYYYRCIDFVGLLDPKNYFNPEEIVNYQPITINVGDLLLNAYQPAMSACSVEKYVVRLPGKL